MLYIRVDDFCENDIVNVSDTFDFVKKKEWFEDEFVRKVIREIDKSEVVSGEYIESPVFGGMPPSYLSSGAKALILMKMVPQYTVYATRCGDNCVPLMLELAEDTDVNILLHHCMKFPDEFIATMQDGTVVHSDKEFVEVYYDLRSKFRKL